MFKSGDPILCPVKAWANTVQRVLQIPGATGNSEVCSFGDNNNNITLIRADHVRSKLRAIVELIGEESLGFQKDDIGLHSIRSGGAMAMFLSGTSVIIIMRVGRWSSEAFLEYIRDQIENFTCGVSTNMLKFEEFFNLQSDETTHNALDKDIQEYQNEDGLDSVSHWGLRQLRFFGDLTIESTPGFRGLLNLYCIFFNRAPSYPFGSM